MLSYLFLGYAVIHLALWLWGWKLWSAAGRPLSLLIVLVSSTLLWYDNFRIGIGRFVGPGDTLYALSVPAFAWHWSMLALLVVAAGAIAREAQLGWARSRLAFGAFCVAAIALAALDIPKIFTMELLPACLADTVRYTVSVAPAQVCPGGQPLGVADAPLVAIITNLVVLGVGAALWLRRRWPWLALGAGAMFVAAGAFARSRWALPVANLGEICITAGLIWTCVRFAPRAVTHARDTGAMPRELA